VPDTRIFPESHQICGQVGFAPYALPGSEELGRNIAQEFATAAAPNCVVLENHGVVVGGYDLADAFATFETVEFTALTLINAHRLGTVHYLGEPTLAWATSARAPLPETPATRATSREKELRKEICDFVHRAYAHRLMTSSWGSFSARIDGDSFVITPTHVDRANLAIEDLVVIRNGKRVAGSAPSRAVSIHAAIYAAHPQIESVVNALPVHATAFSVSDAVLDTRTIPESFLFLKDVAKIPFAHQFGDLTALTRTVTVQNPVALLEHNGALVAGRSILDAFDRLEVLESTAAAIIRSGPLGAIHPMSENVIDELLRAFPSV
jgi:L-fuculose-phosphate aldolase